MMNTHSRNNLIDVSLMCNYLSSALCLIMLIGFNAQADTNAQAGAKTFLTYCSGCHGKEGFAAYEHAPSFSMGERLQKDDRELLQSVLNGINNMPGWRDMLPVQDLRNEIAYIRLMHERNLRGEAPRQGDSPDIYYRFKPAGEQNMDWKAKDKQ